MRIFSQLCVFLWIGGSVAWAGGMEVGDTGAAALGRGGAFAVKADNAAAINYNPAGYAKLRGTHITTSVNLSLSSYRFLRDGPYLPINTLRPVFAAPTHFMLSSDFHLGKGFTVAAGFYTPPSVAREYPEVVGSPESGLFPAPQRFDTLITSGLILFPTLAVAYQFTPWLWVGASFQIWVLQTKTVTIATVGSACEKSEDPTCDVSIDMSASDPFSPTGSLGAILAPHKDFQIGLMLRFPAFAEAKGKAKVTFGPAVNKLQEHMQYPMLTPLEPSATLEMSNPFMLRAGARYIFRKGTREVADIEFNVVWENWESSSTRKVTLEATSLNKPMKPTIIDWDLLNTFSFRLGSSFEIYHRGDWTVTGRAGIFTETDTTSVSGTRLVIFSAKRMALTAGLGIRWRWFKFDVVAAQFFFPKRIVSNSTVRASDFGSDDPNAGAVVGNGTYSPGLTVFGFQVTLIFGDKPSTASPTPIKKKKKKKKKKNKVMRFNDGPLFGP